MEGDFPRFCVFLHKRARSNRIRALVRLEAEVTINGASSTANVSAVITATLHRSLALTYGAIHKHPLLAFLTRVGRAKNWLKTMIATATQDQVSQVTDRAAILSPTRAMLLLGVTTMVGAILRLHLLAARSLWIDEAASVTFASLPWKAFLKVLWGYQGNMALYYFLLHGWIHLGHSEFAVRSLSVLMGVLTIPAIYLLGARLFDRATGLTAAVLLSAHSFHIHWSQEARAYSLLILLLVLTSYVLIAALESPQKMRYWMAFSVLAALCVYAHVFAILVLGRIRVGYWFS